MSLKSPTIEPIDPNTLPEQYRPRVLAPALATVWVVAAIVGVMLAPSAILARHNRAQARALEVDLQLAEETLAVIRTPAPQAVALTDELSRTARALEAARTVLPTARAAHRNWAPLVQALLDHDPRRIRLTELDQDRTHLTLTGHALAQENVLAYAGALDRSGRLKQVIVQALERVSLPAATPALTATASAEGTGTPGVGQRTATPALYDAYEPNDYEPRAIALGEAQWRTSSPIYDVDQATFVGKAGRIYEIRTISLTVGADTVLSGLAAGQTCANDDVAPGDPSTWVAFTSPADSRALATVGNRDQFGPDRQHTLWLVELAGTTP